MRVEAMTYFDVVTDDVQFSYRWFLDEPLSARGKEIDAREFTYGQPYAGPRPERVPIGQAGPPVEFNMAAFDMPVVSQEIARRLSVIAPREIECFPVAVGSSIVRYAILNAVHREACVDEQHSIIMRWMPGDGRPDLVGTYRMVSNLRIDPALTHNRDIFRIQDWEVALIVSERIKDALDDIPDLGVVFRPVC